MSLIKHTDRDGPAAAAFHLAMQALAIPDGAHVAVAYSGGVDSSVLLDIAAAYATGRELVLHAFHIHHGLSPAADAWLAHCRVQCAARGVAFDSRNVAIAAADGSIEEAARMQRYAALGDLCRQHDAAWLLTAHHQDDQAETVLLQLLRGSGVAGLSGMDSDNRAPTLLGDDTLTMARPLLTVARCDIEHYAQAHGIEHVEDESNGDAQFARNAVRLRVMPLLAELFPGFQQRFVRSAGHAQSAQRLLVALGREDLSFCMAGDRLDLGKIRTLDADRIDNLLRYWFGVRGMRMPSSAWLLELRTQLLEAKADAQLCVSHPDCQIRRYRDQVVMTPRRRSDGDVPEESEPVAFVWQGERAIRFDALEGVLHFDTVPVENTGNDADEDATAATGIDAAWLRSQPLWIRFRSGGERLKLAQNRPTKSLKYHYQAADIPAWERHFLPVVGTGGKVIFAAGVGIDCAYLALQGERLALRWIADSAA